MSVRQNKNNILEDDVLVPGKIVAMSGVTADTINAANGIKQGSSGTLIPRINVVAQSVDLAAIGSSVSTLISVAFTSGAVGTVSSGDFVIPLTQAAESGVILTPAQTSTGDTLTFGYMNTTNVNPAAQTIKFLILHNVGV